MIDDIAATILGRVIATELERLPQLLCLAVCYETAQSEPAIYLAYETLDACMARLRQAASNADTRAREARLERYVGEDERFAVQDRLGDQIGSVFNPGAWTNPADPVLLDRDPLFDAWARRAFQALLDTIARPQEDPQREDAAVAAHKHIRLTLWGGIDHARRLTVGAIFPPISFVHSFDDSSADILTCIAQRSDWQGK
jgi:hypothetical protein